MTNTPLHTDLRDLTLWVLLSLIVHGLLIRFVSAPTPTVQRETRLLELQLSAPAGTHIEPELAPIAELPPRKPPKQTLRQDTPDVGKPARNTSSKTQAPTEAEPVSPAPDMADRTKLLTLVAPVDTAVAVPTTRTRHKFLTREPMDYRYTAYLQAWQQKVERIGMLNYPTEARNQNLSGRLRLKVVINADGSLSQVSLVNSSGHAVLDEAAQNIVRLAAPYPEFPPDIRAETDVIEFTRTWVFTPQNTLATGS